MVYVLLGTGFEEVEALTPVDLLRRAGIAVATVGVTGKTVYGGHGIGVVADLELAQVDPTALDMVILPGGLGSVAEARASREAQELLRFAWENGKFVASICAGPTVLADLGITDGRAAVCYPGFEQELHKAKVTADAVVRDGKLITAASAGCAVKFALELIRALKGDAAAEAVAQQIVIR